MALAWTKDDRLALLEAVYETSPDAIALIDFERMVYLAVNPALCALFGRPRDELMALGPEGAQAGFGAMKQAPPRERYAQLLADYPRMQREELTVRRDGVETNVEVMRRAIPYSGGWAILTITRTITEQRKDRQRIELLGAAMDETSEAIAVTDPETMTYAYVNRALAATVDSTVEELLRRGPVWAFEQRGLRGMEERLRELYRRLIEQAPRAESEVRTDAMGGALHSEFFRRAVRVQGRWMILTIIRDITERREAELEQEKLRAELERRATELARSNHDLERFAYVTSHDLSEPLRMVGAYTQLLQRRYRDAFDEDGREFLGYIVEGAQRMKQLIDDLLVYSRAGRADAQMREWPLDALLDAALANLRQSLDESGAVVERPRPLPTLRCDKTGITQLFQNLVGNALKFRGAKAPVVRVTAVREGRDWVIAVADNGIGIAPAYFERIFEIFQRLHSRADYQGSGIGLAICRKIVERHDGRIWVESTPGEGTCFKFALPADC